MRSRRKIGDLERAVVRRGVVRASGHCTTADILSFRLCPFVLSSNADGDIDVSILLEALPFLARPSVRPSALVSCHLGKGTKFGIRRINIPPPRSSYLANCHHGMCRQPLNGRRDVPHTDITGCGRHDTLYNECTQDAEGWRNVTGEHIISDA